MEYLILKTVHILSAILLFGTGLGSAFYKYFADRDGSVAAIAHTNRLVVRADWLFTTPTAVIQPLTGYAMMRLAGWPMDTTWLVAAAVLYGIAAFCWLPVVWLQIRMRDISRDALRDGQPLSPAYRRMARIWFALGIPAFGAVVATVVLMVLKPAW